VTDARLVRSQLILMLGNFLNASGHKGNAQGFKVTSINKLVDTKSSASSSRTLLHFLAKTVTQTMPDTERFLDELAKPADAFKGACTDLLLPSPRRPVADSLELALPAADLKHVRTALVDFVEQHKALENLLDADFGDLSSLHPDDGFPKRMFRFRREAEERLAALKDTLQLADGTYQRALTLYGEDAKSITSTDEFFSVFKTFVTSYKVRPPPSPRAREFIVLTPPSNLRAASS